MGWKCCVPECRSGYTSSIESQVHRDHISFHAFPENSEFRHSWIRAIHRDKVSGEPYQPTKSSRVCSLHFVESDYKIHSTDLDATRNKNRLSKKVLQLRRLLPHSVPTIFTGQPKYNSRAPVTLRTTEFVTAASRNQKQQEFYKAKESAFFAADTVSNFDDLEKN